MRLKIAAALLFVICTTPASAETCEALNLKVDKALETSKASKEQKEKALAILHTNNEKSRTRIKEMMEALKK